MTPDFDPYHKWLGIPPHEQPANHYRLLGISLFESDPDVIEHAADRQMSHLRTHTSGPNSAASQKLLNEISAAKLCLLNVTRRAAYDAQLQAQSAPAAPAYAPAYPQPIAPLPTAYAQPAYEPQATYAAPTYPGQNYPTPVYPTQPVYAQQAYAPVPVPLAHQEVAEEQPSTDEVEEAGLSVNARRGKSRRAATPLWLKIGGQIMASVVGLSAGYAILCWLGPQNDFLHLMSQPPETKVPGQNDAATAGKSTDSQTNPVPRGADNSSRSSNDNPRNVASTSNDKPAVAIDLLPLIDTKRDSFHGDWRMDRGVLLSPANLTQARLNLPIPGDVPDEYELTVVVVRQANSGHWQALIAGLVLGGEERQLFVDQEGKYAGLDRVDGKSFRENRTTVSKSQFKDGVPARVKYIVTHGDVRVEVDGREIIHWSGQLSQLGIRQQTPDLRSPPKLYLGSDATYRFTEITFKRIVGSSQSKTPAVASGGQNDLLSRIDLEHAVVAGEWLREGDALIVRGTGWPRLMLPSQDLPDEYSLSIEAERLSDDQLLGLGLVYNGQQVLAVLDMQGVSGLHNLDDRGVGANVSTKRGSPLFVAGKPSRITALVRKTQIMVSVDGKPIINWKGEASRLSVGENWDVPDKKSLFLGAWSASYRFTKIDLKPLSSGSSTVASTDTPDVGGKTTPTKTNPPKTTKKPTPPRTLGDLIKASPKKSIPEVAERKAAEKQLREQYKDDFAKAKKDPKEQSQLARKLLDQVRGVVGRPAEVYAGLELAIELAGTAADGKVAGEALDELGQQFRVDLLARRDEMMKDAVRRAKTADDFKTVANVYRVLLNGAIAEDRFELAVKFGAKALEFARKSKDDVLVKVLGDGVAELRSMQAAYDEVSSAKQKLETSTDDAEACRQWGRFLCIYKNDWENGRTLWCQSTDNDPLAVLAAEDLEGPQQSRRAAVADQWWTAADSETNALPKRIMRERAVYWYRLSLPSLTGSEKTRVADRLQDFDQAQSLFPIDKWVDALQMVDLNRHKVNGGWVRRGDEIGITKPARLSRFEIPVLLSGSYDLDVAYTLLKGTDTNIFFPVGDHRCQLVINGWKGTVSGLDLVNKKAAVDNSTAYKHPKLPINTRYRVQIHVETSDRNATVRVTLNDKEWVKYSGPHSALTLAPGWEMPHTGTPGLGTYESDIIYHSAKIRLNSGTARLIAD